MRARPFATLALLVIGLAALAPAALAQLKPVQVTPRIWALVGPLGQRNPGNLGNNATFGVVLTDSGVVLIDPGAGRLAAQAIERALGKITDKPVTLVINTGGQDHRWLGNRYWREKGARIVASDAAIADQKDRASEQLSALVALVGEFALADTEPAYADTTFARDLTLTEGGVTLKLHWSGGAHTPGDSWVWVPAEDTVFTGDVVYTERMLAILPVSDSRNWIRAFDAIAALEPAHLVPGHGAPTDLFTATADTRDYLAALRDRVRAFMEAGGDIVDIGRIDQSDFGYLRNFRQLAGRNAQAVYEAMEWE